MEYGFKYSYQKQRCYCPASRKKLLYDGTWVCYMAATKKTKKLTNAWDTAPSTPASKHCYGDRRGYVFHAPSNTCQCPENKKKFIEDLGNGKSLWVCAFSTSDVRKLLPHETTVSLDRITTRHCLTSRLQLKRDAKQVTCRCRQEHLVWGGAGSGVDNHIFCDLGSKAERKIFQTLNDKVKKFNTLSTGISASHKGRFATMSDDPGVDIFDTDDGYTDSWLRRKRTSKYLTKGANGVLGFGN